MTITLNLALPRDGGGAWPQRLDVYAPTTSRATVVFLHGGGGSKSSVADALRVAPGAVADQAWLLDAGVTFVFPQGQAVAGTVANTWSNRVMTSGQDDVAFLVALSAAIRAGTVGPASTRVYLAGHSNGGMMANRMWCESSATFDGYAAVAGPPSETLRPVGGSAPCQPSSAAPYLGIVGDDDAVLMTSGRSDQELWTVNPAMSGGPAFVNPVLVNERFFHGSPRVQLRCGGPVATPTIQGAVTAWTDCGGAIRLLRVAGGDHPIADLESTGGLSVRDELVDFFLATAPP